MGGPPLVVHGRAWRDRSRVLAAALTHPLVAHLVSVVPLKAPRGYDLGNLVLQAWGE